MAYLAILQPDARVQARLRDSLQTHHEVKVVASWAALSKLAVQGALDGCIVDADYPSRSRALSLIRRLRRAHPGLALVAYADFRETDPEIYRMGAWGVDGVVLARRPPWAASIRTAMERSLASARAARVRAALDGRYPSDALRAVTWSVEHAGAGASVSDFAAALGRTTRELTALLREAGLPSPGRLMVWGRLLLAGAYLGRDERTVEDAAFLLGYSTASALARAMKREIKMTPSEVAERGGLACVHARLFSPRRRRRINPGSRVRGLIALGLTSLHYGCATLGLSGGGVDRSAVDAVLDRPPLDQMVFGVLAVDATSGRTLYARNARRHFVPASNEKLLVTSAALSLLGGDYRYRTPVFAVGAQHGDTLDGSLVLVGSGDPTISDRFYDSGEAALAQVADSLQRAGIRHVTGGLVVDVSAWDSASVGPTWEMDDLPYAYGSTGGAFAIDQGELHVVLRGGDTPGQAVQATWTPHGTRDFVLSRVVTAPADSATRVRSSYWPESRHVVLMGRVAPDTVDTVAFAQRDPVRQASATLFRVLEDRGVMVDDGWRVAWDTTAMVAPGCAAGGVATCAGAREVGALVSPPLMDIVEGILEPSQNWMTEQLIRTLGAERGTRGSWREGIDVMTRFLVDSVGVDSLDISPNDGSGLSSHNLVTPRALVRILRYMADGPWGDGFRHALAEPGEKDSTMERRLAGFEGRLFAKTGTISNVNSLSGYLVRDDGSDVIFSLLSNGSGLPSARVRAALDDVVRMLAGRTP